MIISTLLLIRPFEDNVFCLFVCILLRGNATVKFACRLLFITA